jgi:acyl carrier protein
VNAQQRIAARLVEMCVEDGMLSDHTGDLSVEAIGNQCLRDSPWFDSMSLVFLQAGIENEWGVRIPEAQFVAWLRSLNEVAAYIAEHMLHAAPAGSTGMPYIEVEEKA